MIKRMFMRKTAARLMAKRVVLIRPVLAGKYLEYKMAAEDPMVLAKPYTCRRYYEKLKTETWKLFAWKRNNRRNRNTLP
jgi:hypothetical protein